MDVLYRSSFIQCVLPRWILHVVKSRHNESNVALTDYNVITSGFVSGSTRLVARWRFSGYFASLSLLAANKETCLFSIHRSAEIKCECEVLWLSSGNVFKKWGGEENEGELSGTKEENDWTLFFVQPRVGLYRSWSGWACLWVFLFCSWSKDLTFWWLTTVKTADFLVPNTGFINVSLQPHHKYICSDEWGKCTLLLPLHGRRSNNAQRSRFIGNLFNSGLMIIKTFKDTCWKFSSFTQLYVLSLLHNLVAWHNLKRAFHPRQEFFCTATVFSR